MLERNSPLSGERIHGRFGADAEKPGVIFQEIKDFSYLEIALWGALGEDLESRLGELLGVRSLPEPGRMTPLQGGVLLRPDEVALAFLGRVAAADILAATLTPEEGACVVRSHGVCYLRIGGPNARDLLARGIRLDLREAAFPMMTAAMTDIGGIGLLLMRPDAAQYDLLVARSRALPLWRWLTARAAQFGYEVRS